MARSALILAAATLVVGGVVGFIVGASVEADRGAAPPGPPTAAAPPAPTATPSVEAAPAAATAPKRSAAARERAEAKAKKDETAAAAGAGVITGQVLGPDGAPLAGALVRGEASGPDDDADEVIVPDARPGKPPAAENVDEEVRKFETQLRRRIAARRETTTDATGSYSLTGLASKAYSVEAWLAGYRLERTDRESWAPVAVGQTCNFKAKAIRALTARVLLPDGAAPTTAEIFWKPVGGGQSGSATWKSASPGVEVEPGTYEFTASAGSGGEDAATEIRLVRPPNFSGEPAGDALYRSEPQTVTVGKDAAQELVFTLKGRPGILVKLAFASAEKPRHVRIAALRLDAGAAADPARLLGEGRVKARWLDGATQGAISGLDPGSYLVGATFRGGVVGPTATVAVGSDLVVQELLVPGEVRDWVKLWNRAPDGSPVRDAKIECGCNGASGRGDTEVETQPDADGSYRVEHYEKDAPSLGGGMSFGGDALGDQRTYFVRVNSPRFGTVEQNYDAAKDREVTVQMIEPARVRVTVVGWAESPDRDRAVVSLEAPDGRGRHADQDAEIDAKGVATFPPVRPGRYDVVLRLAESDAAQKWRARYYGTEVARVPLTLGAGEATATVALTSLVEFVVSFEGEAPSISRLDADGSARQLRRAKTTPGERQITFKDLAPGRYQLSTRAGVMPVDVPAGGGRAAFSPRPYNAYHLQVTERGYLHDLGLKTGDLVVAIDGVELKDLPTMTAALNGAKAKESSKFTIQRGAQTFDLTADGTKFEEDDGSYYSPWAR